MPAESKSQQRFMGMVHAVQKGDMTAPSAEVSEVAKSMKKTDVTDFAATKTEDLPEKKDKKDKPVEKDASIAHFGTGFVTTCKEAGLDTTDIVDMARGLGHLDKSLFEAVVEALDE